MKYTLNSINHFINGAVIIGGLAFGLPAGHLSAGETSPGQASNAVKNNVLFVAVDDLNDWVGCLKGHPQAMTPNIDRLASLGVLFTNAHCAAPACNPSRASVFSGKMPSTTGVWSNSSPRLTQLNPTIERLPVTFANVGYRTFGTGKLSGDQPPFETYFDVSQRWSPLTKASVGYTADELPTKGTDSPRHILMDSRFPDVILPLNRMPSDRKPESDGGESFDWGPFDAPDSEFSETQITDWAIETLRRSGDAPFFLGVGYYRPHIPLWAPKRFFERFDDSPGQLPVVRQEDLNDLSETAKKWALEPVTAGAHATVLKHDQWRRAVEAYLACVTYVDHEIGRILDELERQQLLDNTIIVLWSDHGWHLGEKQHWGKWTGWERSTRIPLIIVPPRAGVDQFAPGGSKCSQPVSLIDLYPTLTQLCGIDAPVGLEGRSLVPLLRHPDRPNDRAVVTMFDRGNVSIRSTQYRHLRYSDGSEELYNHDDDPNEWDNLVGSKEHAQIIETLRTRFPQAYTNTNSRSTD